MQTAGAVAAQLRLARQAAVACAAHAFGCTATAVPSSSTPANSWPSVTGRFHAARCRSDAQTPHERTRTRTGSVACSGARASTSTTATPPSPDARTARTGRVLQAPRQGAQGPDTATVSSSQQTGRGATMADLGFDGKVAIVTGAGGGLGRQHALAARQPGRARRRQRPRRRRSTAAAATPGPAEQVVDEIKAAGGEAVADTTRVATPEGGAAIVQTALDAFGRIDIVVNNAGILRDKAFHNMDPDLVDPVLDVHLKRRVLRDPAGVAAHARAGLRPGRRHRRRPPASSATSARPTTARRRWASSAWPTCSPSRRASATTSRSTRSRRSRAPA